VGSWIQPSRVSGTFIHKVGASDASEVVDDRDVARP
jgi:hypothetical protein